MTETAKIATKEGHGDEGNFDETGEDDEDSEDGEDGGTGGKSFTFTCQHVLVPSNISDTEKLVMSVSESENCKLEFTNLSISSQVLIKHIPLGGKSVQISPIQGNTGSSGGLTFTITGLKKGKDWTTWAVPENSGKVNFGKDAFENGTAWVMFVEVK